MRLRSNYICSSTVFALSAIIYILTCCRTVFVGDSGELTLALTTGGIAHPPGYPLYTILGYLWLKIFFFLRPALAANLFSAGAASSMTLILFLVLQRIKSSHIPSAIPAALALMFALSYPVWSSATNAEVYSLSGLLYSLALYAIVRYHQEGRSRFLLLAAFFLGLTLAHHYSAAVIATALITALFYRRKSISLRNVLPAVILLFLPLSLYLYLLFRFDPGLPVNWMSEKSWSALWALISGENYQQFMSWPTIGDIALFIKKTAVASLTYFGPGLVILSLPGLVIALTRDFRLALLLIIPTAFNLLIVANYHIPDYEGYLLPALISTAVFMQMFLTWVWERYRPNRIIAILVAGLIVILPLYANYSRCNLSRFDLAERYGRDLIDSTAPHSFLFLKSDNGSYAALYLRYAENYRPDLTIYTTVSTLARLQHRYGRADFPSIMSNLEIGTERIFWGTEYLINQGMNPSPGEKTPRGMVYGRLGDEDDPELNQRIAAFTRDSLPRILLPDNLKARMIYLEYQLHRIDRLIRNGMAGSLSQYQNELLSFGEHLDDPMTCLAVAQFFRARSMIDQSLKWIDLAMAADPYSYEMKDLYVNLATVYRQTGDLAGAGQALSRALKIDPTYNPALYNAHLIKAEMALQQQDWPAALEAFGLLTTIEPQNPLPYFNMAVIYDRLTGHEAEAIRYYRMFLDRAGEANRRAVDRAHERIMELESSPDSGAGQGL